MGESFGIIGGAEDMLPDVMDGAFAILMIIYLLLMFFAFAVGITSYVLQGMGLYTIAERRGLRHKWAAWVPIANYWLLGSIADQYRYVAKGEIKNRRKVLLGLNIAAIAVYFVIFIIVPIVGVLGGEIIAALGMVVGGLAFLALSVVLTVFYYIALYDLYCSCQPNNAVMYLALSIIVSVTLPFFVFFCRKKDLGMPPRKQPAPQPVVIPAVEPVVDPTVVEKVTIPTVEPVVETIVAEAPAEASSVEVDAIGDPSTTEEPAEETTEE